MTTPELTGQEIVLIKAGLNRLKYSVQGDAEKMPQHSPERLAAMELAHRISKLVRKFDRI